jgi:uncharacterized membrane protein YgaE (UPF0421/DUF939 family)
VKKPDWMSVGVWRALRTAWQTFIGVFVVALYGVVMFYVEEPHVFDFHTLYMNGVVLGVAAVIAWWMNRKG